MQLPSRRSCAPRRRSLAGAVTPVPVPGFGLADQSFETDSEAEAAILGAGDPNVASEVVGEEIGGEAIGGDGFIHGGGVEAGFEGGAAEERLLGEGDALDGEQLLGVHGPVGGDGVGAEIFEGIELFEADDGELGGGEAVLTGIPGRTRFALRCAGTGGVCGVGAICGQTPFGDGFGGFRHTSLL